jgi:hypothetical protein
MPTQGCLSVFRLFLQFSEKPTRFNVSFYRGQPLRSHTRHQVRSNLVGLCMYDLALLLDDLAQTQPLVEEERQSGGTDQAKSRYGKIQLPKHARDSDEQGKRPGKGCHRQLTPT